MPDHIHIFLSTSPKYGPADIVKILKGVSARKLLLKFPELKTHGHFWTDSYFVATHGNVSSETIKEYIEGCQR